jgi:hypothetical protein
MPWPQLDTEGGNQLRCCLRETRPGSGPARRLTLRPVRPVPMQNAALGLNSFCLSHHLQQMILNVISAILAS